MVLMGCTPKGRLTEQHDVFFGIGAGIRSLVPAIQSAWPEDKLHIDAWRAVTQVGDFAVQVIPRHEPLPHPHLRLFFMNLGGYKPGDFEEYHYKLLAVAGDKAEAIKQAKQSAFYRHTGFKGAVSHIDDKFGVDVDNSYLVDDILPDVFKQHYRISLVPQKGAEDELHIGYFMLSRL